MNISTENPYEVLGVKDNASLEECTLAYKKLAKKYHPDLNPDDHIASEVMKQINAAYETIKNADNAVNGETQNNHKKQAKSTEKQTDKGNNNRSDKVYNIYLIHKSKTNMIYQLIFSILLAIAVGYLIFYLMIPNMPNTNGMFATLLKNIFGNDGKSILSLYQVNYDQIPKMIKIDYFTLLMITDVSLVVAAFSVLAMLMMGIPFNILYIRAVGYLQKHNGEVMHNSIKVERMFHNIEVFNKVYQISSYVSLGLYALARTFMMLVVVFGVVSFGKYVFAVIYFIVAILMLPKCIAIKKRRIQKNTAYDWNENLNTYFLGLLCATVPYLIATCIPTIIGFGVIGLIASGARRD